MEPDSIKMQSGSVPIEPDSIKMQSRSIGGQLGQLGNASEDTHPPNVAFIRVEGSALRPVGLSLGPTRQGERHYLPRGGFHRVTKPATHRSLPT